MTDLTQNKKIRLTSQISRNNNTIIAKYDLKNLPKSLGNTIGNGIRRTLISNAPGIAIYGFYVSEFKHEFDYSKAIVEDANTIALRMRDIEIMYDPKLSMGSHTIKVQGPCIVKAGDFKHPSITILNTNHVLFNISEKKEVECKIFYNSGNGFTMFDKHKENIETDISSIILINAIYSRIHKVNYTVQQDDFNNSENVTIMIEQTAVYKDNNFIIENVLNTIKSTIDEILEDLVINKGKQEKEKKIYNVREFMLTKLEALMPEFGNDFMNYLRQQSFETPKELFETQLNDATQYKLFKLKKKEFVKLVEKAKLLLNDIE